MGIMKKVGQLNIYDERYMKLTFFGVLNCQTIQGGRDFLITSLHVCDSQPEYTPKPFLTVVVFDFTKI